MPSHGSLSKAGKMQLNPSHKKEWRIDDKKRKFRTNKRKDPMRHNRWKFNKLIGNKKSY